MKCPMCSVDLLMIARQQIDIDYCPQRRGVWLDGGELEKIIAGSATGQNPHRDQASFSSNTSRVRSAGRRSKNNHCARPYQENRYGDHRRH